MKAFIAVLILFLSIKTYSQTSTASQQNLNSSLDQFMWSFSKNKGISKKPLIDFDAIDNWRGIAWRYVGVSNDGKYFAYTVNKMSYNLAGAGLNIVDTLVIQSTKNGPRNVFVGIYPGLFTTDSKQYIFEDGSTLCLLQLGRTEVRKITDVASHRIFQNKWLVYKINGKDDLRLENLETRKVVSFSGISDYDFSGNGEWLACKNQNDELLLYNLATSVEKKFSGVDSYTFSENGKAIVIKSATLLQYVSLPQGDAKTIWMLTGKPGIDNIEIDASGKQVSFKIVDSADASNTAIGYYKQGMDKAVVKISKSTRGIPADLHVTGASFTESGNSLIVWMKGKPGSKPSGVPGVELWNHKDLSLQALQRAQFESPGAYRAIANVESANLVVVETDDKKILQLRGDFALVKKYPNGDRFWEKGGDSCWVVSLKDGSSQLLSTQASQFWFSPDQKWLVYLDPEKDAHYCSYNLSSKVLKDISVNVSENQFVDVGRRNVKRKIIKDAQGSIAAWIENNDAVLVYDNFDIWKLDLTGKQPASHITNSFGKSNSVMLDLFSTHRYSDAKDVPVIKPKKSLVLRGYNTNTKQSGFYKKKGLEIGAPIELYSGPYFMNKVADWHAINEGNEGAPPVKAKNANSWIVQRQSTSDAPNFYETSDFKNFRRLTNFQPHTGFQWLTEELISFKCLDGTTKQGILYKPEKFDPKKKYPVLIPIYENHSDLMHQYHAPTYIDAALVPAKSPIWFLNNGFLVFTPDIAPTGPGAYNIVEGLIQYLKQLPFVDANRLGCASFSASGKLGAYIFTHSKSIAATAIGEGYLQSSIMDVAFGRLLGGVSQLNEVENTLQLGSLWENKEAWLDRTTISNVDKANSPLLQLDNWDAEGVKGRINPGYELYIALRRLEKPVWWLNYDIGGHPLEDHTEAQDYTIRYTQFFDHYLQYAPAPAWMTQGIPYKLKGIENRYELDPQGTCNSPNGEACPICEAWNNQFNKTPAMFQKPIKDWYLDSDIAAELERKILDKRKQDEKEGEIQSKEVLRQLK